MKNEPLYQFYDISRLVSHLQAGHLLLTPTQRLARRIKSAWAQTQLDSGFEAWQTPQVLSLEHWWLECYQQRLLLGDDLPVLATPQQELELWLRCIEGDPLTPPLLRPRSAAKLAREAWTNLQLWQLDWQSAAISQQFQFAADASLFHGWAGQFEISLQELELAVLPQLLPMLVKATSQDQIVLVEFDDLPPLYADLLQQQAGQLSHYRAQGEPASCLLQACESNEEELRQAARWAAQVLADNPRARVGILVPDLQQRRLSVERVMRESLPGDDATAVANISGGMPLASCPPVRTALQLLQLPHTDIAIPELVRLLHSHYRDAGEDAALELELILALYRLGAEFCNAARLRQELEQLEKRSQRTSAFGQQLLQLSQLRELRRKQLPSAWVGLFLQVLETFGWPGNRPLDSIEFQQIEHFHRALEQMPELDAVTGNIDYGEALQRLRHNCMESVFQSQTSDSPVQVLGMLEAAGLQFSHLWITGMSNKLWPAPPAPSPFIPLALQKQHNMPHASAERELNYAGALLTHYRQTAGHIIASYPRMEDGVPVLPSSLVAGFTEQSAGLQLEPWPQSWCEERESANLERVGEQLVPWHAGAETAAHGGSTLISDQSECPFRAFAHHRLKTKALPELGVALSDSDRGGALHDALFVLWGKLQSRAALIALTPQQCEQVIDESVEDALALLRRRKHYATAEALLSVEGNRLRSLIQQWLEVERERPDFEVIGREQACELELGPLRLSLKIDRIDRLANGQQLIIDYKSGSGQISSWLGERPEKPQLPMYAEVFGDQLDGLAFALVNSKDMGFKGLGQSDSAAGIRTDIEKSTGEPDWHTLRQHWQQTLRTLAEDFAAGEARVEPRDARRSCTYCKLESLCRVK